MVAQVDLKISHAISYDSKQFIATKNLTDPHRLLIFILSLSYGFALCLIPTEAYSDFGNYLSYAEYSLEILDDMVSGGGLALFTNEPLWLIGNALLALLFQPEEVVRTIIFISAFTVAYTTLISKPKNTIWILLLLISPIIVKNHLVHIRQGAAIAVFLAGWFFSQNNWRYLLFGITPFIHSSFFIVIFLLILTKAMLSIQLGPVLRSIIFFLIGITIGFALLSVAALFGTRQGLETEYTKLGTSGLGFIFWFFIGMLMLCNRQTVMRSHVFEIGCIQVYLGAYFFTEITARVFESTILLVYLAGLGMKGWHLLTFKTSIIASLAFLWLSRANAPGFGFIAS